MKKHLSALLALCIAVLLLPSAAFAADDDTINGIMYDKEHVTVSDISYSNNQSWNFNKAGSWDRAEWLGIGDCIVSPWDNGYARNSPYILTVTFTSDADFTVSLDYAFSAHYSNGYVAVDGTKYIELENSGSDIDQYHCLKDHLSQKLSAGTHKVEIYFHKGGDNGNFMAYVYNFTACTADHGAIAGNVVLPDCYNGGYTDFTCSVCGYSWRADETPRLEHEFSDGVCIHCGEYKMDQDENGVYLIKYPGQLSQFSRIVNETNAGASAKLVNDILFNENVLNENGELNAENRASFTQFTPIGTPSNPFTGTFDGDGHTVSGLYIYPEEAITQGREDATKLALVGCASGAAVKNVTIKDSYVKGTEYAAGICANSKESLIENCRVLDSRIEALSNAGGICANIEVSKSSKSASVKRCVNSAAVIASNEHAAGIAANLYYYNISIENCLNLGSINASSAAGGIAAYAGTYPYSISSCLDLGNIQANTNKGHIIGEYYYSKFKVTNCGYVLDGTSPLGSGSGSGFTNDSRAFSKDALSSGAAAYYLNGSQSENVSWYQTLGEDPYPTPDSSRKTVYAAGNYFSNINCPHANTESVHVDPTCTDEGYDGEKCADCGVVLKKTVTIPPTGEHDYKDYVCTVCKDGETPDGTGTDTDPIIISNPGNLLWLSQYYNDKLRENASLPEYVYVSTACVIDMSLLPAGTKFDPIGSDSKPFSGIFDGGNSKDSFEIAIDNLSVNALDNAGLFGYTSNASIKNVLLTNADIHGRNNVGAIAGASYSISSTHTVLSRSIVADSKISGTNNVGGIVGTLGNCVLSECSVSSTGLSVSGSGYTYIGGIAAINNGSVINSLAVNNIMTGSDDGSNYTGGITAFNKGYTALSAAYSCKYNKATYSGGIVCVGKTPLSSYYFTQHKINSMADGTPASSEQFASGEICYALNSGVTYGAQVWYQVLTASEGVPLPIFYEKGTVYKNKDGYSNTPELVLTLSGNELNVRNPIAADAETKSALLHFAAYKDGELISFRRMTVKRDCTVNISELGLDIENADSVKIFAWGGTASPAEKPLIYK